MDELFPRIDRIKSVRLIWINSQRYWNATETMSENGGCDATRWMRALELKYSTSYWMVSLYKLEY